MITTDKPKDLFRITFGVLDRGYAKLTVYDIQGKEVARLMDNFVLPGTYAVDFDGSNRSSGVYVYVLECNWFVESKRMVLVK